MKDQLGNSIHSTTAELDHGSPASVKTVLWTQRSLGAALTSSCAAVLWREDVVHGFHIHVIWQRLLLTARFKEFIDCRDIAYFHHVLLKVKEGRQNINVFSSRAKMIWSRIMSARLS